ncbi:MAG: nucleoside monophosphate kinase [Patescibacteria group bacterium]
MAKKAILIFGPPNSGKGTQAKLLADKFGLFQFTTSQLAKDYMKESSDPETLRQIELYKQGILFEPAWTLRVVQEKTREIFEKAKGIVYDGSPRTLYEAEGLYLLLVELFGKENIFIFEFKINESELLRRLAKRLVCSNNTSHSFIAGAASDAAGAQNMSIGQPCPEGDGILEKRDLDKREIFGARMDEYNNRTVPGIEFLRSKHPLVEIDGGQSISKVHRDIAKALNIK